jgi:hypothetical protein
MGQARTTGWEARKYPQALWGRRVCRLFASLLNSFPWLRFLPIALGGVFFSFFFSLFLAQKKKKKKKTERKESGGFIWHGGSSEWSGRRTRGSSGVTKW